MYVPCVSLCDGSNYDNTPHKIVPHIPCTTTPLSTISLLAPLDADLITTFNTHLGVDFFLSRLIHGMLFQHLDVAVGNFVLDKEIS